jgi:hypothetical protein
VAGTCRSSNVAFRPVAAGRASEKWTLAEFALRFGRLSRFGSSGARSLGQAPVRRRSPPHYEVGADDDWRCLLVASCEARFEERQFVAGMTHTTGFQSKPDCWIVLLAI